MNAPPRIFATSAHLLQRSPETAVEHFRLLVFSVAARIIGQSAPGNEAGLYAEHPFLAAYAAEIRARLGGAVLTEWPSAMTQWERDAPAALPFMRLRAAGVGSFAAELIVACGLPEEDPRFGELFEHATGQGRRPSLALLVSWWRGGNDEDRAETVRRSLLDLVDVGLLDVVNPGSPRAEWQFAVPATLWDALRGDPASDEAAAHELSRLVLPETLRAHAARLCASLKRDPQQLVLVRGAPHSGRGTLLAAIAGACGFAILPRAGSIAGSEAEWRRLGARAALRGAMPALRLPLAPGEAIALPGLPLWEGPVAVIAGEAGSVSIADGRPQVTLHVDALSASERLLHWRRALPHAGEQELARLSQGFRLGGGAIHRIAHTAHAQATIAGRSTVTDADVRDAARALHGAQAETLATRLPSLPPRQNLFLEPETRADIDLLLMRCRHRETLAESQSDPALQGVRAMFSGPSGTGKTHAARLVADTLGKDIYRIDLAATVNKYIGETEKNLDRAFAAAENLDAVLLLDEGDALMAGRTDVASANDRYANLETNFLLQRMETHRGILLVTTNAAARIDKAFTRRMDFTIDFRLPDEIGRYAILGQSLGSHIVPDDFMQDVAFRCALSGAQLRAVALQAQLTALDAGGLPDAAHLLAALTREYRKLGAHCPVKAVAGREHAGP